jgi:hypothetical protein
LECGRRKCRRFKVCRLRGWWREGRRRDKHFGFACDRPHTDSQRRACEPECWRQ